jgi:hypothetical protein
MQASQQPTVSGHKILTYFLELDFVWLDAGTHSEVYDTHQAATPNSKVSVNDFSSQKENNNNSKTK